MTISVRAVPADRVKRRCWPTLPKWPPVRAISTRDLRFVRAFIGESKRPIVPPHLRPEPSQWRSDRITAAWIGHSTVLLNFFGVTILTDPVFSSRVGIGVWPFVIGPKRYVAPALTFSQLPPIDLILLSHAHMDHFDLPSLRRFGKETAVVTAHATADLLARTRLRHHVTELAWGEKTEVAIERLNAGGNAEVEIEAFQVNHWGARVRTDTYRGFNGYILRRGGAAVLFGGDTANTALFRKIRGRGAQARGGVYDLALMPIGAYNPWIASHCTPEQAVAMADDAGARFLLPIHHQTFRLSSEPMREPVERFEAALASTPDRVALREVGETFEVPELRLV